MSALLLAVLVAPGAAGAAPTPLGEAIPTCFPLSQAAATCLAVSWRFGGRAFVVEEESICDLGFPPLPAPCDVPSLRTPSVADEEVVEVLRTLAPEVAEALEAGAAGPAAPARAGSFDEAWALLVLNEMADEIVRRAPGLRRPEIGTYARGFHVRSSTAPWSDRVTTVDRASCGDGASGALLPWSVLDLERCAVASLEVPGLRVPVNDPNIGSGWNARAVSGEGLEWRGQVLWAALDELFAGLGRDAGFVLTVRDAQDGGRWVEVRSLAGPPPPPTRQEPR